MAQCIVSYDKMFPNNHKTIFVLDHTPYFGISCEDPMEFDFNKARGTGFIPLAPITKSLWTCSVESALEYCRIVWDLFPTGKLIRFIVSDSQPNSLNNWSQQQQNITHLVNGLSTIGVPPRSGPQTPGIDFYVLHGLQAAIQALCECSEIQHEKRTSLTENASKVLNRGRIICITSGKDQLSIDILQDFFQREIVQANKVATASDHLIPIHHCHVVIIHVYPNNVENNKIKPLPNVDLSSLLSFEFHCVKASVHTANKLSHLLLSHYDLASTTVTGIPMKEEQNASSSANYDVEIFHSSLSHSALLKGNATDTTMVKTIKEGAEYETVTLKWCTPRGMSTSEMHNVTAMHRITPVDVNSRPSSCLINFLLNGRSVLLEMIRRGGGKVMSHLLAAHGGEIFIHSLNTARSILEDPPSISEGCGGRVTDYRITDFGILMQQNKLFPIRNIEKDSMTPLENMKLRLDRYTKYWPITISATSIFNFKQYIEPLLALMLKDVLTEEEVVQCKQCIYSLMNSEAKHEPLQTPSIGQRGKGPKREEQYRQMWTELETYICTHNRSDQHNRVLHCLLECRNKDDDKLKIEKMSLGDLDHYGKVNSPSCSGPTNSNEIIHRASVIRATTDSPMSPPLQSSQGTSIHKPSLLDIWISKTTKPKRTEFSGRLIAEPLPSGGCKTQLYSKLKAEVQSKASIPMDVDG
uniref:Protein asunder n=1 Tax=Clastoptera arizonana TaxID=38151 RepID=A0A1B6E3M0_9HEMI